MAKVYTALVHYPVYNRHHEIITTAITNLDIHDIARSATTFGLKGYYLIQPDYEQKQICLELLSFWQEGYGLKYNPDRAEAFQILKCVDTLEDCLKSIEIQERCAPKIVVTSAKAGNEAISYQKMRQKIADETNEVYLLLFGTGWGLTAEVMALADYRLPPIKGMSEYNHLSVRAAAAIIFDRLLGE